MNIVEYRESKIDTKVTADIAERWQKRVVTRGLHTQGRVGGAAYLEAYGKSIGVKKCVKLACQAESVGASEFAAIIWEKAFFLETGQNEQLDPPDGGSTVTFVPAPETDIHIEGLPEHLQPGKIATLQPQDAKHEIDYYIHNDDFWAQPKIDGHRLLAICTPDAIYYQKRSLALAQRPSIAIGETLLKIANRVGIVILDGEFTWFDDDDKEHRTAAQARTANDNMGRSTSIPVAVYAVFDCLFANGEDITKAPFSYRDNRAHTAVATVPSAWVWNVDLEEIAPGKAGLLKDQQIDEREGVVFRDKNSTYLAGKSKTAYRVKFLTEFKLKVLNLTDTDAEGRLFGAIETELGLVGTGFTMADQEELVDAFKDGELEIEIVSQGLTENGRLWHPRYIKIARL